MSKKLLKIAYISNAVLVLIFAWFVCILCLEHIDNICTFIVRTEDGLKIQTVYDSKAVPFIFTMCYIVLGAIFCVLRVALNKFWPSLFALMFVIFAALWFMSFDLRFAFATLLKDLAPMYKSFNAANAVCRIFGTVVILDTVAAFVLSALPNKNKYFS